MSAAFKNIRVNDSCLRNDPSHLALSRVALPVKLNESALKGILCPPLRQELIRDLVCLDPPALPDHGAKETARAVTVSPGKDPALIRERSPGGGLLDVDVLVARIVRVVLDVQGDAGGTDGLALDPADTLQTEDVVK